jgi:hypothetical protein
LAVEQLKSQTGVKTYLMTGTDQGASFAVVQQDTSRHGWENKGTMLQVLDVDGAQGNIMNQINGTIGQVGQSYILRYP